MRQDQVANVAAGPLGALTFERQRRGKRSADRLGHGLPYRPLGHGAQMVESVVEQPMGEVPEGLPVGGVEGIAWIGLGPAQRHDRSLEFSGGSRKVTATG